MPLENILAFYMVYSNFCVNLQLLIKDATNTYYVHMD